ncbi:MAG: hypothetical protein A2162_04615 [Deltaproteobacteria bacterium RBG_13_52_11b]|nr:MAG: hypothetical protein A2162_04615 [Deltaproteobacteria bacterium RBG_13_52_11b]
MAQKLQIILMPGGAGTLKRVAIPKPLMVFGICCVVLCIGMVSYIVADYRTARSPWREFVRLEQENAEQREKIRCMTEEIIQVAHQLGDMPEYDGEGEIGERLLQAYDDVQSLISSASKHDGSQSLGPVRESYRSLIREMHTSMETLDRELDSLAVLYNPRVLYGVGGSSPDGQSGSDALEELEAANRALIERRLRKIAREVGVAPGLALSMAKVESRFDHKAVSPKGAIGVLQVMPHVAWEAYEVSAERLFDPDVNIRVGLTFMKSLLKRFDHNLDLSLAAYNAGPTRVVEAGYQVPPIRQTQDYVKRVKQAMNEYGPMYWHD